MGRGKARPGSGHRVQRSGYKSKLHQESERARPSERLRHGVVGPLGPHILMLYLVHLAVDEAVNAPAQGEAGGKSGGLRQETPWRGGDHSGLSPPPVYGPVLRLLPGDAGQRDHRGDRGQHLPGPGRGYAGGRGRLLSVKIYCRSKMAWSVPRASSSVHSPSWGAEGIRFAQKQRQKRQYAKQAREAAKQGVRAAEKTAVSAEKLAEKAAGFVKRHPVGVVIALACLLLLFTVQSCASSLVTLGNGIIGGIGASTSCFAYCRFWRCFWANRARAFLPRSGCFSSSTWKRCSAVALTYRRSARAAPPW